MIFLKLYRNWESWDLNSDMLNLEIILLTIMLSSLPGNEDEQTFHVAKAKLDDLLLPS